MTADVEQLVVEQARRFVGFLGTLREDTRAQLSGPVRRSAEEVLVGLDALHASVAAGTPTPSTRGGVESDLAARRRAYVEQVERIRRQVADAVPADAVVAVISRGDPALVDLPVAAVHLPCDARGVWAGYHPTDGADALAHLSDARRRGATHLVVPATSRWWLDFYGELRDHLEATARTVVGSADATVFELGRPAGAADVPTARYHRQVRNFTEVAALLLPAGARVAVVTRGDDDLVAIPTLRAGHFPTTSDGRYGGHPADDEHALVLLAAEITRGTAFLAVPAPLRWWTSAYPRFGQHLRRRHRCIADQHEVGQIFELDPPTPG